MALVMKVKLALGMTRRSCRGRRTLNNLASWTLPTTTTFLGKYQLITHKQDSKSYGTYEGTERQPYPLMKDETLAFLEDCLDIEQALEGYKQDPEGLLNKIVERMKKKVPFTTGHLFGQPLDEASDVIGKYHILRGHGGSCGTLNPFTNAILKNIGYKTTEVNGFNPRPGYVTHVSTVACDVTFPGSRHLIEPGARRPLLRAIPLDFEEESPVYKFHCMYNKFFKRNNLLIWCAKSPQRALSSLEDFERVTDAEGKEWQIVLNYRLGQENARVRFNKFWHELVKGEKGLPEGVDTFVFNAFLEGKVITALGTPKELVLRSLEEDGSMERVTMTADDLRSYFTTYFGTFSQSLLNRVIAADYRYIPHDGR